MPKFFCIISSYSFLKFFLSSLGLLDATGLTTLMSAVLLILHGADSCLGEVYNNVSQLLYANLARSLKLLMRKNSESDFQKISQQVCKHIYLCLRPILKIYQTGQFYRKILRGKNE